MLKVGDKAPKFTLKNQKGAFVNFENLLGERVLVLYFYPRNFTPGCIAEACSFRDSFEDFKDAGALIYGISSDAVSSHAKFAKRYQLPFSTLSDPKGEIRKRYQVKKELLGLLPGRETFVIDKDGVIRMRFNSINASKHMKTALNFINSI